MKKILLFVLVSVLILSFVGCTKTEKPAGTPVETTPSVSDDNGDGTLEYGKNTREQSVQVNQKDVKWATYSDLPSEIILEKSEFVQGTMFVIKTPDWTRYVYEDTVVFNNQPDYIMYTFGTEQGDYGQLTISNSIPWKDLVDWKEETTETTSVNGVNVIISSGKCYVNTAAHNEKLYVMAKVEIPDLCGCIIGITEENAFHTVVNMKDVIKEMVGSIVMANEGEPEDVVPEAVEEAN